MTSAFVRHGQTDWNLTQRWQGSSDNPLNATGREQARAAARTLRARIADEPWDVIVSSPLLRAKETASIIAAGLRLPLGIAYPELVERDYGAAEGATDEDITFKWPEANIPGLEPLESVAARGLDALERIEADHGGANVLIVCHGILIQQTLTALLGHDSGEIINGSVSRFSRQSSGDWTVHTINDQPVVPGSASVHAL